MKTEPKCQVLDLTNINEALKHYDFSEEKLFAVVDLLADLKMYCFANSIEFDDVLDMAHKHFEAERPRKSYKIKGVHA